MSDTAESAVIRAAGDESRHLLIEADDNDVFEIGERAIVLTIVDDRDWNFEIPGPVIIRGKLRCESDLALPLAAAKRLHALLGRMIAGAPGA